jgi:glycosyltransferase involved in cell wall biosynthesis
MHQRNAPSAAPGGPIRATFDSRPAKNASGVGRYARSLLEALCESEHVEIVEDHNPRPRRCDIYHSPWMEGALLHPPVPMVVTLHNLIQLKRRGEYLRSGIRNKLHYLAVQRAVRVIVPTRTVADDAIRRLRIPAERIVVIPEAVAPKLRPRPADEVAAVRAHFRLPERYLLWVGGLQSPDPCKRVRALAKAKRTLPLVLVGPTGRWARELPDVTLTDRVSDDELAAIYTGAQALVFPSVDEGFALAPIEALACGTPVAACDLPALREVLDGRVVLSEVDDLDGLIIAAEAARRPAPAPLTWSWEDAAAATTEVYADALRAPARWRSGRC